MWNGKKNTNVRDWFNILCIGKQIYSFFK
jgi:hypothetical protein